MIWSLTVIMSLLVFNDKKWKLKSGLHPIFGLGTLVLVTVPILGGLLLRWTIGNQRWGTRKVLRYRFKHKLFAYCLLLGTMVTLLLGGIKYKDNYDSSM
jgi:hypothetical protein